MIIGIKAEPRAPPATRLNSVSEILLAALNASIEAEVPKALATRICRTSPARLLSTKAMVTIPAARAICWLAERESGDCELVLTIYHYNITNLASSEVKIESVVLRRNLCPYAIIAPVNQVL